MSQPYGQMPVDGIPDAGSGTMYPGSSEYQAFSARRGLEYPQERNGGSSDNDFYNIVRSMTEPEIRKTLDHFLRYNPPTDAAMHRLKTLYRAALDPTLVGSYIRDQRDYDKLWDTFQELVVETALGLTCYDVNESYNHILNIIVLHFQNTIMKGRGGFAMKRVLTTTAENVNVDGNSGGISAQEPSLLNRIRMR
jgi:hypothetical protein